jgi:hypothetical protein
MKKFKKKFEVDFFFFFFFERGEEFANGATELGEDA